MSSSIKKNIVWNVVRTAMNLAFPLITFPYVTRVLGPTSIGLVNYASAIVAYFALFANFGFPIYGIREIAKNRNNREFLSDVSSGIFTSSLVFALIVGLIYVGYVVTFQKEYIALYIVLGLSIVLNSFSFEWFYQGLEDYKYITIRSFVIKLLSVIALFFLVRNENDVLYYAGLTTIAACANNIFNFIRLNQFIRLRISFKNCFYHIRSSFFLFFGTLAVSIYTYLNSIMLGALADVTSVGYFTTGNKLIQVLLQVIAAVTATVIPRISFLIGTEQINVAVVLQKKLLNLILYTTIPLMIGALVLSEPIVLLLGGKEFLPSVEIARVLSLLIVVIPLSNFLGMQILYPIRKEKYGTYAVMLGALTNLILNYYFIAHWGCIGAAISTVCAECVVTIAHYGWARPYMSLKISDFILLKPLLASLVMGIAVFLVWKIFLNIFSLFLLTPLGFVLYCLILKAMKDSNYVRVEQFIMKRINERHLRI